MDIKRNKRFFEYAKVLSIVPILAIASSVDIEPARAELGSTPITPIYEIQPHVLIDQPEVHQTEINTIPAIHTPSAVTPGTTTPAVNTPVINTGAETNIPNVDAHGNVSVGSQEMINVNAINVINTGNTDDQNLGPGPQINSNVVHISGDGNMSGFVNVSNLTAINATSAGLMSSIIFPSQRIVLDDMKEDLIKQLNDLFEKLKADGVSEAKREALKEAIKAVLHEIKIEEKIKDLEDKLGKLLEKDKKDLSKEEQDKIQQERNKIVDEIRDLEDSIDPTRQREMKQDARHKRMVELIDKMEKNLDDGGSMEDYDKMEAELDKLEKEFQKEKKALKEANDKAMKEAQSRPAEPDGLPGSPVTTGNATPKATDTKSQLDDINKVDKADSTDRKTANDTMKKGVEFEPKKGETKAEYKKRIKAEINKLKEAKQKLQELDKRKVARDSKKKVLEAKYKQEQKITRNKRIKWIEENKEDELDDTKYNALNKELEDLKSQRDAEEKTEGQNQNPSGTETNLGME